MENFKKLTMYDESIVTTTSTNTTPLLSSGDADKLFNYKCTKCSSTYVNLKKPLPYTNCQIPKRRNPNPVICNGRLVELKHE